MCDLMVEGLPIIVSRFDPQHYQDVFAKCLSKNLKFKNLKRQKKKKTNEKCSLLKPRHRETNIYFTRFDI